MDEMTQQNAALVEQAAAAAESLQEQALQLAQAVSVFKLSESGIGGAMTLPAADIKSPVPLRASRRAKAVEEISQKKMAAAAGKEEWEEF
jgi:methyl-accepting chemotaxis protein